MIRPLQPSDRELFLELTKEFYHSPAVLHEVPEQYFVNNFEEALSESPYLKAVSYTHLEYDEKGQLKDNLPVHLSTQVPVLFLSLIHI